MALFSDPIAPPCSLNGEFDAGGTDCVCDPGWIGKNCGQHNFLPAPPLAEQVVPAASVAIDNAAANATWGMSVVGPLDDGVYHGYMTEIANECTLVDYGIASQVVHMTARHPRGPWVRQGVALAGFAHNPQAVLGPNNSVILFHIGEAQADGCLADCRGTAPAPKNQHPPKPLPRHCKQLNHGSSVAVSASPFGPFARHPYIFEDAGQPGGSSDSTNPTPMLALGADGKPNGTLIVALRRATSEDQPIFIGHVDSPAGPYVRQDGKVVATSAGNPSTYEEDPFLYQTKRGFHMLTRRAVHYDGGYCGGGHLYSSDLRTWFYGESTYGGSNASSMQCNVDMMPAGRDEGAGRKGGLGTAAGSVVDPGGGGGRAAQSTDGGAELGLAERVYLTSRERPTVFTDTDGSRYLFTGAAVNVSMWIHSFTLVQQINLGA